jgi:hypothetical protein
MSKKSLYQQYPENKIPGWRILHRGDTLRATDMQFTQVRGGQLTEVELLLVNVTAKGFEGCVLGVTKLFSDYPSLHDNFFYRKVEAKHA